MSFISKCYCMLEDTVVYLCDQLHMEPVISHLRIVLIIHLLFELIIHLLSELIIHPLFELIIHLLFVLIYRFGFGSWQLHAQTTPDLFYGKGLGINDFYDMGFVQFQAASDLITRLVVKGFNKSLPPFFTKLKHLQMVMFDGNSDEFVR